MYDLKQNFLSMIIYFHIFFSILIHIHQMSPIKGFRKSVLFQSPYYYFTEITDFKHSRYTCKYVAPIGFERPWMCSQRLMPQFLMAGEHLLCIYRSTTPMGYSPLQQMHMKINSIDVGLLFYLRRGRFSPAAKLRFSSPCSSLRCKLRLRSERSLATSSHISMNIIHMSLLHTSFKRGWRRSRAPLPLVSSSCRRTSRILILSGIRCICPRQQRRRCWRRVHTLTN